MMKDLFNWLKSEIILMLVFFGVIEKRVMVCLKGKSLFICVFFGFVIVIIGVFWGWEFVDVCFLEDGDLVINCFIVFEVEYIVKEMCEGMGSCVLEGKVDKL